MVGTNADGSWGFIYSTNGTSNSTIDSGHNLTTGVAYDLTIVRSGSDLMFFVDGTLVNTVTFTATIYSPGGKNQYFALGSLSAGNYNSPSSPFVGHVKGVRYTIGAARYTANYTVPELSFDTIRPDPTPPNTATAHKYWRIKFNAFQPSGRCDITELQFRETVGVAETPAGGNAFASEAYNQSGYAAENAFDNNTGTNWLSISSYPYDGYLGYEFVTARIVNQIALTPNNNGAPVDFDVQCSDDGITWATVWNATTTSDWTNDETRLFTRP